LKGRQKPLFTNTQSSAWHVAKNGEILNTLKVTRSVRDVVEKYATQRRTLMIVIVARRVTTHIIGKPRGSFVGAKKEFIFVEDAGYATALPRSLFLTVYLHFLLRQTQRKKKNIL
jgi:hypothetical protein